MPLLAPHGASVAAGEAMSVPVGSVEVLQPLARRPHARTRQRNKTLGTFTIPCYNEDFASGLRSRPPAKIHGAGHNGACLEQTIWNWPARRSELINCALSAR